MSVALQRLICLILLALVWIAPAPIGNAAAFAKTSAVREEEVFFQSGPFTLAGTLLVPDGPGPYPALVFVHGSSPNLRAAFRNYVTRLYVQRGVAVLIYDKRGAGQSTGVTATASLSDLADDVVAGVAFLTQRAEIDSRSIGLVGDSQAGWVIPLAATRAPNVAFVALVSASAVRVAQQEAFHSEQRLLAVGHSADLAAAGRRLRQLLDAYSNAVHAGQLPAPESFRQSALVNLGTYNDPAPALRQLQVPALIILGEADTNVPTEHSAYLFDALFKQNGNRDYTIIVYPGANHAIQLPQTNARGETSQEFVPGYQELLATWVHDHGYGTAGPGRGLQGTARDASVDFGPTGIYGDLPWPGLALLQLGAVLFFLLSFLGTSLLALRHTLRAARIGQLPLAVRVVRACALAASLLNLLLLLGFGAVVGEILANGTTSLPAFIVGLLPLLAVLALVFSLGLAVCLMLNKPGWSRLRGEWGTDLVIACTGLLFIPFLNYWQLFGWH